MTRRFLQHTDRSARYCIGQFLGQVAMRAVFLTLLLGILISGSPVQGAVKPQKVSFLSKDKTSVVGYFYQPEGSGSFPVIIALHGCGGLFQGETGEILLPEREDWLQRFLDAGYAVLFPDSHGARGHRSICEISWKDRPVKLVDQVADLVGAINWVADLSVADRANVGLVGWGTGATVALRVLDARFSQASGADARVVIAFYPICDWVIRFNNSKPRLLPSILIGAADDLNPAAPCEALAEMWGSPIELYEGAYHSFDSPNKPVRVLRYGNKKAHNGTNEAAREKAIKYVMQLLADSFAEAGQPKQ